MNDFLIPILRTSVSFILLLFVTFSIGKHIGSHKNYYSFALSVVIGSYIANMGFDTALSFKEMSIAFLTLVILFSLFNSISSRSRSLRKWLSGRPTVLIEKGKLLEENMKKVKFSIDDLNQHLRERNVFNIYEVEFALLEVDGELSILKKKQYQSLTKQDLHLPHPKENLPVELVMDGKIIDKNADDEYNREWIESEFRKRNLNIEEVYYAVINSNGTLFIDKYKDHLQSPVDVE